MKQPRHTKPTISLNNAPPTEHIHAARWRNGGSYFRFIYQRSICNSGGYRRLQRKLKSINQRDVTRASSRSVVRDGWRPSKNALMKLNELKPGLEYRIVSQTGPGHQPTFTVRVQVNEQVIGKL